MVMASGMITSRTIFSRGCEIPIALSFSRSRLRLQRGERAFTLLLVEGVVDRQLHALATVVGDLLFGLADDLAAALHGAAVVVVLRRFDGNWAGHARTNATGLLFLGDGRGCRRFGTGRACELDRLRTSALAGAEGGVIGPRRARTLSCSPWRRRRRTRADGGTRSRGLRLLRCRHGGSRGCCRWGRCGGGRDRRRGLCSHRRGWRCSRRRSRCRSRSDCRRCRDLGRLRRLDRRGRRCLCGLLRIFQLLTFGRLLGLPFGLGAFLHLSSARSGQGVGARLTLGVGNRHHSTARRVGTGGPGRSLRTRRRRPRLRMRRDWCRRRRRCRCFALVLSGRRQLARLALLDDDRLRAAVAEILPHVADSTVRCSYSGLRAPPPRRVLSVESFVSVMRFPFKLNWMRLRRRGGGNLARCTKARPVAPKRSASLITVPRLRLV